MPETPPAQGPMTGRDFFIEFTLGNLGDYLEDPLERRKAYNACCAIANTSEHVELRDHGKKKGHALVHRWARESEAFALVDGMNNAVKHVRSQTAPTVAAASTASVSAAPGSCDGSITFIETTPNQMTTTGVSLGDAFSPAEPQTTLILPLEDGRSYDVMTLILGAARFVASQLDCLKEAEAVLGKRH
ncbi:MAG: hypothetical protein RLO01_13500 [Thalassobaculaceae bacterium]